MRFQGTVCRDGKQWLAEVPVFPAMTQGHSREEVLEMMADWLSAWLIAKDYCRCASLWG